MGKEVCRSVYRGEEVKQNSYNLLLRGCDVILIEGLELALHLDLMRALLDFINDVYSNKVIVIETHSELPLRWGITKGWSVYYIERNNIVRLSKLEDITNIKLFKKELEALSL